MKALVISSQSNRVRGLLPGSKRLSPSTIGMGSWLSSPFDLVAYTDSDYAGASLDRKSTTVGCQLLRCRLISWQCKKQTVIANSTTEVDSALLSRPKLSMGKQEELTNYKAPLVDGKKIIILNH
ncbi:uncharacterized mitochondrial protein-like protein [Tanacetum coccineum]|uniref:Uncharacterized mitochondrial protein-like protein n=1 Tax=Tanacetum coccineum TaxID=301880 RepID=A0ABQ5GIY8_9ASTR